MSPDAPPPLGRGGGLFDVLAGDVIHDGNEDPRQTAATRVWFRRRALALVGSPVAEYVQRCHDRAGDGIVVDVRTGAA